MEADFVIIGSGSAGSAMAYRLSEDGRHSVIVIEFGGPDIGPLIQMPAALSFPMNMETYEQIEVDKSQIEYELNFLYESLEVEINFYGTEIIGVNLPEKLVLEVKETVPGVKGDTKTNAMKDAYLASGYLVKVPMFIETGEKIIVNTTEGTYVSRA